jgi:hypothetical protein
LKTDTDGYESEVLLGSLDYISDQRPILFFEYAPFVHEPVSGDGRVLLESLRGAGYTRSILYDNRGEVLVTIEPSDMRVLLEVANFLRGSPRPSFYLDIATFHEDDREMFERFRASETA